jgi:hypothetical protein
MLLGFWSKSLDLQLRVIGVVGTRVLVSKLFFTVFQSEDSIAKRNFPRTMSCAPDLISPNSASVTNQAWQKYAISHIDTN